MFGGDPMKSTKRLTITLLMACTLVFSSVGGVLAQADSPIPVKVLTVAMFESGEMTGDFAGEAQNWVEGEGLDQIVQVPGSYSPVYCNADGHCLVVTGMGTANATAT